MHQAKKYTWVFGLTLFIFILVGCASAETTEETAVGLANPASVFCQEQGGQLEIRRESGGEVGYCLLPDGRECEEWAFFRGECLTDVSTCQGLGRQMELALGVGVTVTDPSPFTDFVTGEQADGCQALATGTEVAFGGLAEAITAVQSIFTGQNWQADINYSASGPTGELGGYRLNDAFCLWSIEWTPAADADCPDDQPISACQLAPEQKLYTAVLTCR